MWRRLVCNDFAYQSWQSHAAKNGIWRALLWALRQAAEFALPQPAHVLTRWRAVAPPFR